MKSAVARSARAIARQFRVWKFLSDALEATTTYSGRETPSTFAYERPKWRPIYGSKLELRPKKGAILSAEGKFTPETEFDVVRVFSHQPGEILVSQSRKRTNGDLVKYMVQPNHSLHRIT